MQPDGQGPPEEDVSRNPDPRSVGVEKAEERVERDREPEIGPVSGVTPKALVIGTGLCVLLAFMAICDQALGGGLPANEFGTGALFLLFVVIGVTAVLKRLGIIRSGLRAIELLVIFSMLLVASALPVNGVMMDLLPHMAGFTHYTTPENKWETRVLPLLPDGITIKDPAVVKGFFEGGMRVSDVPYRAWLGPLAAWAILLGALYVTMISLMVILRKRWVEEERLAFPLAQLPLNLVEGQPGERPLLRSGIFWLGFAVPSVGGLTGIVHRFFPFVPAFGLTFYFYTRIYRDSIGLVFSVDHLILGISYLVSLDILGSIILFTLVSYVQMIMIQASGSAILGTPPYRPYAHQTHLHQEVLGALIALAVIGLYQSRRHLKDVFGKAFGSAPEVDDRDEMMSYRAAVLCSIVGVAFVCYWLRLTGISWWVVPTFVAIMLATYLGITRILAEAGVPAWAPLSPMQVFLHTAGTQNLGGANISGFFLAQPWAFSEGPHVMASSSTALKLTHRKGLRSRPLFFACSLALIAAGVAAAMALLNFAYTLGAYGFTNSYYVIKVLNYHLNYYGGIIKEPTGLGQPIRLLWSGIGLVVMAALVIARKRIFWWPVHPIGFPIGIIMPGWWITVLLAWLVKRNVLKYGGPALYARSRPFFLGMILGQAVSASMSSIVTMITGRA